MSPLDDTPSPAIDLAFLQRYTLGDADLQKEILELFVAQLETSLGKLKSAETAQEWLRAAHTLKGSARTVGAGSLADSAQAAESISDPSDPDSRHKAFVVIEREAQAVAAFLSAHRP
ncbi:Hpt domain-containing protein [Filomicrobium sp.]|uniref:Hpt domain-containing protein n=1 Tax=Filomicrobium sp. TaxID=2024831 RepID=UPI002582F831|nr:Hpt domain-containing protein [Filomicrobium sp.]MCV0369349.1 Hpt domain-containing protein [Filomicrobium sp.]